MRTYYRPRIIRPRVIRYRTPVVTYAQSDRRYFRREISNLRDQVRREKQNDAYVGLEVQESLDEASMALDDASQMLDWGYSRDDIRAALQDASAMIEYARQERRYALDSMRTYQSHAQAQLDQAAYHVSTNDAYFERAQPQLYAAQQAYEEANVLARAEANSDKTLAAYKKAAERADSTMRALYATTGAAEDSFAPLVSEHETLEQWMDQVLELATQWKKPKAITKVREAKMALQRAENAIEAKDAKRAQTALDEATVIIDDATSLLGPDD